MWTAQNRSEDIESTPIRQGFPRAQSSKRLRSTFSDVVAALPPPESKNHRPRIVRRRFDIDMEPIRVEGLWTVPDLRVLEHSVETMSAEDFRQKSLD